MIDLRTLNFLDEDYYKIAKAYVGNNKYIPLVYLETITKSGRRVTIPSRSVLLKRSIAWVEHIYHALHKLGDRAQPLSPMEHLAKPDAFGVPLAAGQLVAWALDEKPHMGLAVGNGSLDGGAISHLVIDVPTRFLYGENPREVFMNILPVDTLVYPSWVPIRSFASRVLSDVFISYLTIYHRFLTEK